ncbi:hypothetical protein FB45DRAFT_840258 [Roridomyces roridus]|uniref:F-box domain-containing protein n=1 Tax=Roridomyces roridus TaxID=1738132 RepID=A0AAD7FE06_9AGAR|nr:hypothetical protein FB45DRAFT_840258 [Roridomyces roridus]
MHRALLIAEIVEMMCSHLRVRSTKNDQSDDSGDSDNDDQQALEGRRSLVALASTCKALRAPALDAFWKEQDSIIPWLSCFPEDLFNIRPVLATEEDPLLLERPFAIDDWRLSDLNAARVERLTFEYDAGLGEIFKALSIAFPFGSLFPRLRSLSWTSICEEDFIHIRVLLTPGLSSIAVTYEPSAINCSILSTLTRTCPRLVEVDVRIPAESLSGCIGIDEPSLTSNSQFVQSLSHVKSLSMPTVSRAAIFHIGRLPDLAFLRIRNMFGYELPYLREDDHEPRTFFRDLRALHLPWLDIETAIQLIQMGSQFQLETLEFGWNDPLSRDEMEELYNLLAKSCSHTSLVDLIFDGFVRSTAPNPDNAINDRLLQILFCFHNLTRFSFTSPEPFDLCDTTLTDAARAWPRLETFELALLSYSPHRPSKLTMQSLYAFAQHCPGLRFLHIQVDATNPCTMIWHPRASPPPQLTLTELCIAHSDICPSAVNAIAGVIFTVFPNLRTITGPSLWRLKGKDFERRGELWKKVEGLLSEFAPARSR